MVGRAAGSRRPGGCPGHGDAVTGGRRPHNCAQLPVQRGAGGRQDPRERVRLGLWLATRALEQSVFQGLLIALVVSVATLLVWLPVLTPRRGVVGARGERLLRAVCSAIGAAVVLLQYNALSIAFGDPLSFPPLLLVPITVVAAVVWWRAGAVLRAVRRAAQDPAPEPRPSPSGG
jgi:hypothetical protein